MIYIERKREGEIEIQKERERNRKRGLECAHKQKKNWRVC